MDAPVQQWSYARMNCRARLIILFAHFAFQVVMKKVGRGVKKEDTRVSEWSQNLSASSVLDLASAQQACGLHPHTYPNAYKASHSIRKA